MQISLGLLILRAGTAALLIALHGWQKFQNVLDGNLSGFPDPIGIGPEVSAVLAALAEFVAAAAVAVGLLTRISAAGIAFTMGVAAFVVHENDPWSIKERALLYLIVSLTLMLTGAGRFSVDAWLRSRKSSRRAA